MNSSPPVGASPPKVGPRFFAAPLVVSLLVVAALAAASWWVWRKLPADARIPDHWNAAGQVDKYRGRDSLFVIPGLTLALTILFLFLPRIEPRRTHLLLSSRAYRAVWIAIVLFSAGLQLFKIEAALGVPVSAAKWIGVGLGALFLVIGNFLGKVRSNFVFGVRTPWTLSSELSWSKTHRLAGWMFVGFGLALVAGTVAGVLNAYLHYLVIGFAVILLVTLLPYSYFVWRSDSDKTAGSNDEVPDP